MATDVHRDHLLPGIAAGLCLAWAFGALWLLGPGAPAGAALPLARRLACALLGLPLILVLSGAVRGNGRRAALFSLAAPLGLLWALYGSGLQAWWTRDDPCLLRAVATYGIVPHFIDPTVWRALSGNVLMPWSLLSLGLDLQLFGLHPGAFYLHQLLAFALLLLVAYQLLRTFLRPATSGLTLALFVLSAPACAVVMQLMNRHYLEGFLLALLSLGLFRRALVQDRLGLACLGAVVYFLAASAKEVFVPLVVVLPFIPLGTLRQRLIRALPYAAAAIVYGIWRIYLLGWANVLSSYGTRTSRFEAGDLLTLPSLLGLTAPWQGAMAIAVLIAAGLLALRSRQHLALTAAIALAVATPLLPVLTDLEPRHLFVPLFAAITLIAFALDRPGGHRRTAMVAVVLLLVACGALARAPFWRFHPASAQHYEAEGRFVLEAEEAGVLMTTLPDVAFLACVDDLRRDADLDHNALAHGGGPGFCGAPCACEGRRSDEARWRYETGRIVAVKAPAAMVCENAPTPFTVTLTYDPQAGRLHWQLGPQEEGAYRFVLVTGDERAGVSIPLPVPRAGSTPLYLRQPQRLIVQHHTPAGVASSPVLTIDPTETMPLGWSSTPSTLD